MKKLDVTLAWSPENRVPVGQLAESDRRVYFEFDPGFVARGLEVSPIKWPLRSGLIEHTELGFGPLPGWLDDALPDGWGLLLMDRAMRQRGLDPRTLSPLDRLAYLGSRTMGALQFHPPSSDFDQEQQLLDLHALGKNAREVLSGTSAEVLPELLRAGGSPGGARPKVLVGVRGNDICSGEGPLPGAFDPWIIKFSAKAELRDAGPVEYAYSLMARAAGIEIPETQLFRAGKSQLHFGVRRFDRPRPGQRLHMHTFGNLIHTNFRVPSTDYADLLRVTRLVTKNQQDVLSAFRQMVFNIVTHNRDDHAKNFAFLMNDTGAWSLSPAYDLTCSLGPGGEHSMTVLGEGAQPTRAQVLKLADDVQIPSKHALAIIDEVNTAAVTWPTHAATADTTRRTAKHIQSAIRPL